MERNPWWQQIQGPFPTWDGKPVGIKADGGGSIRGHGRIGNMRIWQAAHARDAKRRFRRLLASALPRPTHSGPKQPGHRYYVT